MNDLEKKSIECIKNMPIEETTYQVARNVVLDYTTNLQQELENKDRIIRIMEKYLELICDLGYDYDGCKTTGDLCLLINELVRYARLGCDYNTTETIFIDGKKKYNILNEELKEKSGK